MKHELRYTQKTSPGALALLGAICTIVLVSTSLVILPGALSANSPRTRTLTSDSQTDVNSPGFRLIVCDGPVLPVELRAQADAELQKYGRTYQPCDFNGVMKQIQHLINLAVVVGVLAAIALFMFAGGLYLTGKEKNISWAWSIFPKVGGGFIIMLSAWFIVYQILAWLTGEGSGFSTLLGK
jgi:hypothetical protein